MKGYTLILLFAFVALLQGYSFKFRDQAKETKPESKTEVADEESRTEVADQEDEERTKSEVPKKVADPAIVQFHSLGCWNDQGRRAFNSNAKNYDSDTIQQCADRARLLGNVVFAVQNGNQCWTAGINGAKYAIYGKSTKCNYGKGAGWTNSVYRLGSANRNQKWRNLGCYKDEDGSGRAFAIGPQEVNNGDALNLCRDLALKRGHNFFGLEDAPWWKRWCYTGNNLARHTKHGIESGCSDGRGGSWHVNVFQVVVPRLIQVQPLTHIVHVAYHDEGEKVEK